MQRIRSDAELYAVLSKRRIATDDEDTAAEEPSAEMKGLVEDITSAFGDSEKGGRKPQHQSGADSEANAIEEKDEKDEEDADEEEEEDAPTRRSRRIAKANAGRQARQRARKWSESEESDDEQEEAR